MTEKKDVAPRHLALIGHQFTIDVDLTCFCHLNCNCYCCIRMPHALFLALKLHIVHKNNCAIRGKRLQASLGVCTDLNL